MPINAVYVRRNDDPETRSILRLAQSFGYPVSDVRIERGALIEGEIDPSQLHRLFANPLYEDLSPMSFLDYQNGPVIEVAYQLAVVDPETPSIFDAVKALGIENLRWVRLTRRYQLVGLSDSQAQKMASEFLYNTVVQELIPKDKVWQSLYPHGKPDPLRMITLEGLTDEELSRLSQDKRWNAPLSQLKAIQDRERLIGRSHTDAERYS